MMTYFFAVIQQIAAHDLRGVTERVVDLFVDADLVSVFSGITLRLFVADAAIVDDNEIEMNLRRVFPNCFQVLEGSVAVSLAWLRHQITYKDLRRRTLADHTSDLRDEQVR